MGTWSRRELLATFLGVPAALAGCARRADRDLPPGEIVGASASVGHRIRDAARFPPRPMRWESPAVVIVGAGVAGLAAAWRFRHAGVDNFVILELEGTPGGNARSGKCPVSAFPWGAHYIPAPLAEDQLLVRLLNEMGILEGRGPDGRPIVAEQFLCRDPQERLYYEGRWYEGLYLYAGATAEDLAQWHAFRTEIDHWVAWRDGRGRPAFAIPVASGSDDAEVTALDRLTMADWLDRHGWTSPRLRWLVDYSCRDDYGTRLEQTSAWAGVFYFASRRSRPGGDSQPLITWPEGNGRLVAYLASQARRNLRTGLAAVDVTPAGQGRAPAVDVVAVPSPDGPAVCFHAGHVVFAAPHFLSRYLIQPYRERPPRHVAEFEYGSWMVANLQVPQRPAGRGFPLAWDNVFYDSPSLGYVVATHQRGPEQGPTVLTYYYPFCEASPREGRARLLGMDWQACAELTLADLGRAHSGLPGGVERLDVMRWGHAMIRPRPGFIWGGARMAAARPFRGIHFAHSDLSGVSLFEEAFYHGVRAAEEVLAARGLRFRSFL